MNIPPQTIVFAYVTAFFFFNEAVGLRSESAKLLFKSRLSPKLDHAFFQKLQDDAIEVYFSSILEHTFKKAGLICCIMRAPPTSHPLGPKLFGNQKAWVTFLTGDSNKKFGEFIEYMKAEIRKRKDIIVAVPEDIILVKGASESSSDSDNEINS